MGDLLRIGSEPVCYLVGQALTLVGPLYLVVTKPFPRIHSLVVKLMYQQEDIYT